MGLIWHSRDTRVNICDICDIFADLIDYNINIHIWQFPVDNLGKICGPAELHDYLNYSGTDGGKIEKIVKEKGYLLEIEPMLPSPLDNPSIIENSIKTGDLIRKYNYNGIVGHLSDLDIIVINIAIEETPIQRSMVLHDPYKSSNYGGLNIGRVRIMCIT